MPARASRALVDFGAPNDVIDVDALMTRDMVTQFGQPPYRIDLLSAIDGVTFAEVWKGASMATVDGSVQPRRGAAVLKVEFPTGFDDRHVGVRGRAVVLS